MSGLGLQSAFAGQALDDQLQGAAQRNAQWQIEQAKLALEQQKVAADSRRADAESQRQQQDLELRQQLVHGQVQDKNDALIGKSIENQSPDTPLSPEQLAVAPRVGIGLRPVPTQMLNGQLPTTSDPNVAPPTSQLRTLNDKEQQAQDFETAAKASGLDAPTIARIRLARMGGAPVASVLDQGQKQPTVEAKSGTINGKPATANFQGGKFYDPATGSDISGSFVLGGADNSAAQGARSDQALQKSYEYTENNITTLRKSIADSAEKFDKASTLINDASPQSDALVAPLLLSAVAGGSGSGLRMNQAEINRIVGGRSNWESLQASLQKWSTDPSKANSLTDTQRQQMRDILSALGQKAQARMAAINQAEGDVADATTPTQHKQILKKLTQSLDDLATTPTAAPTGSSQVSIPPQVLAAGPGRHTFANGQIWDVAADGKSAKQVVK